MFCSVSGLSLAEIVDISVNTSFDYVDSIFAALYLVDDRALVFKLLINSEEVRHFIENMLRELADIGIRIISRIVERDSDDLVIRCAVVDHGDNSDGVAFYQSKRLDSFRTKHQNIERVSVLGICSWDKAVVCRIVR